MGERGKLIIGCTISKEEEETAAADDASKHVWKCGRGKTRRTHVEKAQKELFLGNFMRIYRFRGLKRFQRPKKIPESLIKSSSRPLDKSLQPFGAVVGNVFSLGASYCLVRLMIN